jgi:hypothetical protein
MIFFLAFLSPVIIGVFNPFTKATGFKVSGILLLNRLSPDRRRRSVTCAGDYVAKADPVGTVEFCELHLPERVVVGRAGVQIGTSFTPATIFFLAFLSPVIRVYPAVLVFPLGDRPSQSKLLTAMKLEAGTSSRYKGRPVPEFQNFYS